jgi:hypothetical protein
MNIMPFECSVKSSECRRLHASFPNCERRYGALGLVVALTVRCANEHGRKTLELIFVECLLVLVPCVLLSRSAYEENMELVQTNLMSLDKNQSGQSRCSLSKIFSSYLFELGCTFADCSRNRRRVSGMRRKDYRYKSSVRK